MALSKEVEVILRADARSARAAILQIERAAGRTADTAAGRAIKAELEGYADKLGNTAANLVSRALESTNRKFADDLKDKVTQASIAIGSGIRAAMEQTDPQLAGEQLRKIKLQMQAFEKLATDDVQDAMTTGLKDAFSAQNLRDSVGGMADLFEKSLNSIDPNDLGGFAKSLGSAASKGFSALAKGMKAKETASMAAGDAAGAARMAQAATALSAAAVAFAAVGAAIALFVAYAKAADEYQAKLNKTLLNGASVADIMGVAYQEGGKNLLTMSDTMKAAREAAVGTAVAFKMTTEETAGVLSELNSAGITYKRIINGAETAEEAQQRFASAISRTITYASMLGVSVSELAQYQNTLMKDVNMTMNRTFDVFQAINDASMASGMATKTFFTAISQATSGMALYNVRIDQAIGLVKSFGKIVGETDAGKVLGDLTGKKGVEERLRISTTAIEAVGLQKVQDLFRRTTEAGATEFQKNFAQYGDEIRKVFTDAGQAGLGENLMSGDPATRAKATKALADLPDDIRERIKAGMENIEGGAASRSFGAFSLSAKGQVGGIDEVAGVMNKLDMAGKILMMDYQASILEKASPEGLESATSKATLQQFLGALGLDEDQLEPILRYRQYAAAVGRVREPGQETETDRKTLEGLGFKVEGDKVTKDGQEIKNLADIVYGLGVNMESADAAEQRRLASEKQRMEGTITAALNAWVQGKVFESALAPTGLLGKILGFVSDGAFDPEKFAKEQEERDERAARSAEEADRKRKEREALEAKTGGKATPEVLAARAKEVEAQRKAAGAQALTTLGSTGFSGKAAKASLSATEFGGTEEGKADIAKLTAAETAYKEKYAAASAAVKSVGTGDKQRYVSNPVMDKERDQAQQELQALMESILGKKVEARLEGENIKYTPVQDAFISKDGAMYHGPSADNILMFKDGGPLDPRTGGGSGNVVININGGDQAMVYRTVARAMRAAQA